MSELEQEIISFPKDFELIENSIKLSIMGQHDIIRSLVTAIIAGGNTLLEGLPGLGKTQLVKAIGKTLDLEFSRVQFTPDLMPADITGTVIYNKNENGVGEFKFQKGPIFANIVLADEINRASPKTQSALLEAMQEHTVTVGTETYSLPSPFFVIATQNPLEMEGTYPLPEAQMDRFMFKLNVKYPDKKELLDILNITTGLKAAEPDNVFAVEKILSMRKIASGVPVSQSVYDYVSELVLRTHQDYENSNDMVKKYVRYGSSPRGAQALVISSKIYALIDNRYNVSFEDVRNLAFDVLRHRIILNYEALSDNIRVEDIITKIIEDMN